MRVQRLFASIATSLAIVLSSIPASAVSTQDQREIEEALTCQCGCGLTVASCNHLECGFAVPARKRIADALAAGQSAEQILAGFKGEYGEKVLSTPVPEGFNVLAWIAPFAGIAMAGIFMFSFFRRRATVASAPAQAPKSAPASPSAGSDERLAQLRYEVEELER